MRRVLAGLGSFGRHSLRLSSLNDQHRHRQLDDVAHPGAPTSADRSTRPRAQGRPAGGSHPKPAPEPLEVVLAEGVHLRPTGRGSGHAGHGYRVTVISRSRTAQAKKDDREFLWAGRTPRRSRAGSTRPARACDLPISGSRDLHGAKGGYEPDQGGVGDVRLRDTACLRSSSQIGSSERMPARPPRGSTPPDQRHLLACVLGLRLPTGRKGFAADVCTSGLNDGLEPPRRKLRIVTRHPDRSQASMSARAYLGVFGVSHVARGPLRITATCSPSMDQLGACEQPQSSSSGPQHAASPPVASSQEPVTHLQEPGRLGIFESLDLAHPLGIPDDQLGEVIELSRAGLSLMQISKRCDCGGGTVRQPFPAAEVRRRVK